MKSNRRQFIQAAGTAGAALFTLETASADDTAAPPADRSAFTTELFLDNQLLEATPGVSRKLHPARKHLLNPVIRPERWCEGTYIEPYTTMYDAEANLFKMWARAGSDAKVGSAAVVCADGQLYFRYQNGLVALIEATNRGYKLNGSWEIPGAGGDSWAHPVNASIHQQRS